MMKIIFDCFGTLIDTGSGSVDAAGRILENVGSDIDKHEFYAEWKALKKEMMQKTPFHREKEFFELSLEKMFEKYSISADAKKEVKPMTDFLFGERWAFPDTYEILKYLDEMGIEYAIGSTTDTDSLMHYLKFNHLSFERIFTSEDMRVYKPAPGFYKTILEKTGWNVSECLFVGDSPVDDVKGPQSVGMKAVLVDRKGKYNSLSSIKPDYVIKTLMELADII